MYPLIKARVQNEKAAILMQESGVYVYDVDARLTKTQIKHLFKHLFDVDIVSIRTHALPPQRLRGRTSRGYQPRYKRALFTIKSTSVLPWKRKVKGKNAKGADAKEKTSKTIDVPTKSVRDRYIPRS